MNIHNARLELIEGKQQSTILRKTQIAISLALVGAVLARFVLGDGSMAGIGQVIGAAGAIGIGWVAGIR